MIKSDSVNLPVPGGGVMGGFPATSLQCGFTVLECLPVCTHVC